MHRKKKEQEDTMDAVFTGAVIRPAGRPPGGRRPAGPDPVTSGLQQLFGTFAAEPIPDEFLRLLDEFDASAASASRIAKAPLDEASVTDESLARHIPDTGTRQ